MQMEKQIELVKGDSHAALINIMENINRFGQLRHVTVFYNNYNFLLSNYDIRSQMVHLVLDCDNVQLQVENANCGYGGAGPSATVKILTAFGLNTEEMKYAVSEHTALDFEVNEDGTVWFKDTFELFGSGIGLTENNRHDADKIFREKNIQILLPEKKIFWYNPQRHGFIGFLRLLKQLAPLTMEYYIGESSPLEGGLFIDGLFTEENNAKPCRLDVKGVSHVNLVFYSDRATIVCLIDKQEEKQVIESVYYALTGEHLLDMRLFNPFSYGNNLVQILFWLLRNRKKEIHETKEIGK